MGEEIFIFACSFLQTEMVIVGRETEFQEYPFSQIGLCSIHSRWTDNLALLKNIGVDDDD